MRRKLFNLAIALSLLLCVTAVVWYGSRLLRMERAIADRQKCASNLISLGQAIMVYCNENRGNLPPSWREILLFEDATPEIFVCPASDDVRVTGNNESGAQQLSGPGHCSYQYLGSGNIRDLTPDIVVAAEYSSHHGSNFESNVLFGDGQVRHMTGAASKHIYDAILRGERPVRYPGKEGQVMRKSG